MSVISRVNWHQDLPSLSFARIECVIPPVRPLSLNTLARPLVPRLSGSEGFASSVIMSYNRVRGFLYFRGSLFLTNIVT